MSRLLLALLALVTAAAFFWWSRAAEHGADPAEVQQIAGPASGAIPPAPAPAAQPPAPEPVSPRTEAPAASVAAPESPPADVGGPSEDELREATWVTGRVVWPADTPPDEVAYVVAIGRKSPRSDTYHRAPVQADGAFRVAFFEKRTRVRLELEARYLYLKQSLRFRLNSIPDDIVLEPELGARVVGRVLLPDGGSASELVGSILRIEEYQNLLMTKMGRGKLLRIAPLDDALTFEANALPPGSAGIAILAVEGWPTAREAGFELRPGQTADVELTVTRGSRISGHVVDENGKPLWGVGVRLQVTRGLGNYENIRTETEREGQFEALVPAGSVMAEVSARDFVTSRTELGTIEAGQDLLDAELVLPRGAGLRGLVTWADGSLAAGAEIDALDEDGDSDVFRDDPPLSDEEGRFHIAGIKGGPFTVSASAAEPGATLESIGNGPRAWGWVRDVELGASVLLTLAPGTNLRGSARDDAGAPLPSFDVHFVHRNHGEVRAVFDVDETHVVAGVDGTFELQGLPPGHYWIWASASGSISELATFALPATEPLDLVVPRQGSIRGRVLSADGEPLPRAQLHADYPDHGRAPWEYRRQDRWARSGHDGTFAIDPTPAGKLVLRASAGGLAPVETSLTVPSGGSLDDIELRLSGHGRIEGQLHDSIENPAERQIEVHLVVGRLPSVVTDSLGRFSVERVPPGRVELVLGIDFQALREGHGLTSKHRAVVEVEAGETSNVTLGADPRLNVSGRVVRGGVGVGEMPLDFVSKDGARGSAVTDPDGWYTVELPRAGLY